MGLCLLLSAVLAILSGCAARVYTDPVAAMGRTDLPSMDRISAMNQAAELSPDDPQRIATLKEMLSGKGHALNVRTHAVDQLLAHDAVAAKTVFKLRYPSLPSLGLQEYIASLIAKENWVDFTPSLVRSLASPMPFTDIEERIETATLFKLHPNQTIEEITLDVIATNTNSVLLNRWRLSAWDLLHQMEPDLDRLHEVLASKSASEDPFLADLHAGYVQLGVIPETKEEVRWLLFIRKPENIEWWDRCATLFTEISPVFMDDLRLRHLPVLLYVDAAHPDWFTQSRGALLADLTTQLSSRKHYFTSLVGTSSTTTNRAQKIQDWGQDLDWADLLAIKLALECIEDSTFVRSVFEQSVTDRNDTSTEYGGIIDWEHNAAHPIAIQYMPFIRVHDAKFIASDEMLQRGYMSLFHYHFHVQEIDNREYAGPGSGDLHYANGMRINGLVFSSVGSGKMNVDFYCPGRIVVDLGTIQQ